MKTMNLEEKKFEEMFFRFTINELINLCNIQWSLDRVN